MRILGYNIQKEDPARYYTTLVSKNYWQPIEN
jgi:hypothetical protein